MLSLQILFLFLLISAIIAYYIDKKNNDPITTSLLTINFFLDSYYYINFMRVESIRNNIKKNHIPKC